MDQEYFRGTSNWILWICYNITFDEKISFAKITFKYSMTFLVNVVKFYTLSHHAIPCRKPVKRQETLQNSISLFQKLILFVIL